MGKAAIVAATAIAALTLSVLAQGADMGPYQVEVEGTNAPAHVRQLSDADLKTFYLRCSREAIRGRLGTGEIALCSQGYEVLLQRTFKGDFHALLAWRRSELRGRNEPPANPILTP